MTQPLNRPSVFAIKQALAYLEAEGIDPKTLYLASTAYGVKLDAESGGMVEGERLSFTQGVGMCLEAELSGADDTIRDFWIDVQSMGKRLGFIEEDKT